MQSPDLPANAVEIGDARPGDIGWILRKHGQFYCGELGFDPVFESYVAEAVGDFARQYDPPRDARFMARRGDRLVGSTFVKRRRNGWGQVRFVYVEPHERGSGVGRRLIEAAVAHARAGSARGLVLETVDLLAAARRLYAAVGFSLIHSEPEPFFEGARTEFWSLPFDGEVFDPAELSLFRS